MSLPVGTISVRWDNLHQKITHVEDLHLFDCNAQKLVIKSVAANDTEVYLYRYKKPVADQLLPNLPEAVSILLNSSSKPAIKGIRDSYTFTITQQPIESCSTNSFLKSFCNVIKKL
ncbi:hypothetical protein D5R81_07035 [Parashewanella spongiae]|uniref:Uncharacterized protein n=1 Tax=Parashewanella spongiae TaxID=342950 RepID=A0A3A6U975_9GAMM|nr:hypothetical protein [Parashewanella spongiae]MCL1077740.1 hypothetical protein [Parashewanella spongiae]RJY18059.1 hypothetical protein D5R81_07035 [Parashewanella spongiae]